MSKKIYLYIISGLIVSVLFFGTVTTFADEITARRTTSMILIDGESVDIRAYNINDRNYFQLRDLGAEVGFAVDWDGENDTVLIYTNGETEKPKETIEGETDELTAIVTASKILVDGEEVSIEAYNVNGRNYFQLRELGEAVGFDIDWDEENNAVLISTRKEEPTPEPTDEPVIKYPPLPSVTTAPTLAPAERPVALPTTVPAKSIYEIGDVFKIGSTVVQVIDVTKKDALWSIGVYEGHESTARIPVYRYDIKYTVTTERTVEDYYIEMNVVSEFGVYDEYARYEVDRGSIMSGHELMYYFQTMSKQISEDKELDSSYKKMNVTVVAYAPAHADLVQVVIGDGRGNSARVRVKQ